VKSWAAPVVVVAAAFGAGCDGPHSEDLSRDAQVYLAAIRDVLDEEPAPDDPEVLPVVFVVGVGEERIDASVQAEVVAELDEDAEVQFADARSEVVLKDEADTPVRDDGLLIAVGDLAPEGDPVDIAVEVYRSDVDWSKRVFTVERVSSQWTVTSSSVLPTGEA
jgi:hypothetical protein